jgi:ribonucleoside-diphosphate reductase alpha chain
MRFERFFTKNLVKEGDERRDVLDLLEWKKFDVVLTDHRSNKVLFELHDAEAPARWSQQSVDIVASKYFRRAGVPSETKKRTDEADADVPRWLATSEPTESATFGGERSVKQVFRRMVGAWTYWAWKADMFTYDGDSRKRLKKKEQEESAQVFYDEVAWTMYHQYAAPNSPQFFNAGIAWAYGIKGEPGGYWRVDNPKGEPKLTKDLYTNCQAHACFILGIEDTMFGEDGIYEVLAEEARIFKLGSGSGINYSRLRADGEPLSGGGTSSGLLSFLRIFDRSAECIKSGGVTRRSARAISIESDHPDIVKFIRWKYDEEMKARALISAGYETDFNGEAYRTISGQNGNNSVAVSHDFMKALKNNEKWETWWRLDLRNVARRLKLNNRPTLEQLHSQHDIKPARVYEVRELWKEITETAWKCAEPGLQFDGTMNDWNTLSSDGIIEATNPCHEHISLNQTACNLCSINLLHHFDVNKKEFNLSSYEHTILLWQTILEITIFMAQLPSQKIAKNTWQYRQTGLGPANLGTFLMVMGVSYDSIEGRTIAAAMMSVMTGCAYTVSAKWAAEIGSFPAWERNSKGVLRVVRNHRRAAHGLGDFDVSSKQHHELIKQLTDYEELSVKPVPLPQSRVNDLKKPIRELLERAKTCWDEALSLGGSYGYRNSQTTTCAPTGTVSFVMGCDSTGVEPNYALVSYKTLAGGGTMKIVNGSVRTSLRTLGYSDKLTDSIVHYVEERGHVHGAPGLKKEHESVFKCAVSPLDGDEHTIAWKDHIQMVAALQSFVSGGISKTINMPVNASAKDVSSAYELAYDLGCKGITVYRDGCKASAPLNVKKQDGEQVTEVMKRLPNEVLLNEVARRNVEHTLSFEELKDRLGVTPQVEEEASSGWGTRRRPSEVLTGFRHRIMIGQARGYLKVFVYEDGRIAELFLTFGNPGSSLGNVLECWSIVFSVALQRGEPLSKLCKKFINVEFEPKGFTGRRDDLKIVSSPVDYIARLLLKLFDEEGYVVDKKMIGLSECLNTSSDKPQDERVLNKEQFDGSANRQFCPSCGARMMGGTAKCPTCDKCGYFGGCG